MNNLEEMKRQLEILLKEREKLSATIRDLRYEINYLETQRPNHKKRDITQSKAYQMFGKKYRELTAEELKIYNYHAQKKHRKLGTYNTDNTAKNND